MDDLAVMEQLSRKGKESTDMLATHGGLVANTVQIMAWMVGMKPGEEVTLMAIPMFHAYGMIAGMALGMALGATLVMVPNPRDLKDVLENITEWWGGALFTAFFGALAWGWWRTGHRLAPAGRP